MLDLYWHTFYEYHLQLTYTMYLQASIETLVSSHVARQGLTNAEINPLYVGSGRGPLKNTMDVINAAKKISEAGSKLDKLCRQIADQVSNLLHLRLESIRFPSDSIISLS